MRVVHVGHVVTQLKLFVVLTQEYQESMSILPTYDWFFMGKPDGIYIALGDTMYVLRSSLNQSTIPPYMLFLAKNHKAVTRIKR